MSRPTTKKPAARKPAAKKKATTEPAARKSPAKKAAAKPRAPRKPVLAAVNRDLAALAKIEPELAKSGIAAAAQALAREIDDPGNSATSKASCARALADTLSQLRQLAPKSKAQDGVDEISARRAARLARSAET